MMNKLLIISLLIGMVSCTKEVIVYNQVDNNEDVTYTEGSLNIYLTNMGDPSTRADGDEYADYFPSANIYTDDCKHERGLFNSLLISFDSDFLLEYYNKTATGIYYYNAIDNLAGYTDVTRFTLFPLGLATPVTTGAHYFYVICNLSEGMHQDFLDLMNAEQGVLTKDEFERMVLTHPLDTLATKFEGNFNSTDSHKSQRCVMTNMTSPAPHYMASKDQNSNEFYPSTNDVDSHIGKIFAKASLAYVEENKKLSDVKYRIVNVPKSFYLMPNIFDGQVETPYYEENFQNDYDTQYNTWFDPKYKLDTNEPDWQDAILNTTDKKTYVYCMENGHEKPLQGNSTFLLIEGKYTPTSDDKWLDKDGTSGSASSDGTFWRIKRNGYYTTGYYNEEPDASEIGNGEAYEYKEGITYYPIWLKTRDKYQVQRNGYYKIILTEVISAGASSPENVIEPTAPLENPINRSSLTKSGDSNSPEIKTSIKWQQGGF